MNLQRLFTSLAVALPAGALIAALSPGNFFTGWLAASLLLFIAAYVLLAAWNGAGRGRSLAALIIAAFVLRLGVGMALGLLLPVYGHDEETQNAGYSFYDAYQRDAQAWDLAQSDRPILASFGEEFANDQYGGLLSISALVYRTLSPDAQRPFLILILGAFTFALGVPFFWKAVSERWNPKLAGLAAWILVLYPDGIFFGSSQMREPFLIGLICIAFWGMLTFSANRKASLAAIFASLIVMALISSRVAAVVGGVLAVWFWLEHLAGRSKAWKYGGLIVLALALLGGSAYSWNWLRDSSHWDMVVTQLNSGRIPYDIPEKYLKPFIVGYGLTQPVLPAAISDDTIPIWRIIVVLRSLGWYILAPMLVYAVTVVWKARPAKERTTMLWLGGVVLVWVLISSIRAGGDLTDNPRYRTIFLPWLALLGGWGVRWAIEQKDLWLARFVTVELIFVGFFSHWYFSRNFHLWERMPIPRLIAWITILSALVLVSGWAWDLIRWLRARSARKNHVELTGNETP